MKNKYFLLTTIGIVCMVLSFLFILNNKMNKHHVDDFVSQTIIEFRNPIKVNRIQVLSGGEYDLILEDGRRVKAVLGVVATPDAKDKVVSFLNRSNNPRVILKKQDGNGTWLISLFVTTKNVENQYIEIDLSTWLREKNLVYNW